MKRSSLFVCCGITLLYLSDRLDSRTVAPIIYLTTAIPNVADPTGYRDGDAGGQSGYDDGGVGGKSRYYGGVGGQSGHYGGVGGQSGYYGGGVGSQPRNYGGGGVGLTGHYGGRSPTAAAATTYGSYGHRTMPESAVRGAISPVRDERSYALYESPNTYEYMTNPPRKSGKVSRVPETERLPPGDDVEFIDDGGGGDDRRPAKDRHRGDGDGGEQSQDADDRPRVHQQNNNSKRINRNKPKAKSGRKLPAREDDYTNDGGGGGGGGDAEPVGSSTTGDMREGATAKKPRRNGYEEVGRKNKNQGLSGDGPVKHKIHKKNEYSKRQQFFDEEHVDHGKKKPKIKSNHDGHKSNGHGLQKQTKKKKRQQQQPHQQQRSTQKPVRRTTKREKKDDRGTSRVVPQGYGQVVAVR